MDKTENPFARLGPVDWAAHPALAAGDGAALDAFLADTFASAQLLIDSIPLPAAAAAAAAGRAGVLLSPPPAVTGRPRAQTDGAVSYFHAVHANGTAGDGTTATFIPEESPAARLAARHRQMQSLRSAWKEVRVPNPRHVAVFKHAAGRDGYGGSSWFARRSLHRHEVRPHGGGEGAGAEDVALSFDLFRRGLLKEFGLDDVDVDDGGDDKNDDAEKTNHHIAKVDTADACKIRTMEVARHLEGRRCGAPATTPPSQRTRTLHVFQLQAQFPRPTAARDFVTMLLTESSTSTSTSARGGPRQFMVVSKPCVHPAAPLRPGYVRAEYESVEVVREVQVPVAATGAPRKTRSSMELGTDDATPHEMAVEWLMITRNNPGGNVPRFLVDRSTPSSIVSDANRFLDWLVQQA